MSKTVERTIRILVSPDGSVVTHNPAIEAEYPLMRAGTRTIFTDGSVSDEMDRFQPRDLDLSTVSDRERQVIEENNRLRKINADLMARLGFATTEQEPTPAPVKESSEGPVNPEDFDPVNLDNPPEPEQEPIQFQPEPEVLSDTRIKRMKMEEAAEYAQELEPGIHIPADAKRDDVIEVALKAKAAYLERTGA